MRKEEAERRGLKVLLDVKRTAATQERRFQSRVGLRWVSLVLRWFV